MDILGKVGSLVSLNHILLIQVLNFGVLLFILYKLLYNRLVVFMDQRAEKIENNLKEAEASRKEAAADRAKAAEALAAARKENYDLIQKMHRQGLEAKEELLHAAKQEAKDILARAEEEIALELGKAKDELRGQIAALSVDIAEKILRREVKLADQEQFVEMCLNELERHD